MTNLYDLEYQRALTANISACTESYRLSVCLKILEGLRFREKNRFKSDRTLTTAQLEELDLTIEFLTKIIEGHEL